MVPPCRMSARDEWGNACVPSQSLTWSVAVVSPGLATQGSSTFECDVHGLSTVTGLYGVRGAEKDEAGTCEVTLTLAPVANARLTAAVQHAESVAKQPGRSEAVRVLLAPSTLPVDMLIAHNELELPSEQVTTEDGTTQTHFLVRSRCSVQRIQYSE